MSERINTFGYDLVEGEGQNFYDRLAFANRVSEIELGMTRVQLFQRIADTLLPGWFEWNEWSLKMVSALCYRQWVGVAGCSGCVDADTRIPNPITGESPTIKELCESETETTVMTLNGPAHAEVPFVKGKSKLFEVRLSDGSKFVATAEHVVLSEGKFVEVKSLSSGDRIATYDPKSFSQSSNQIARIRSVGYRAYYDIEVPGVGHYFAEGAIHHNSGKTRTIAGFAALWWLCDAENSCVFFCSTTMKALKKRGWAEIQSVFWALKGKFGHMVDSRTTWQCSQGDDKHAIFGIAVLEGNTDKAAANIQGVHTLRQLIVIDEAEAVPAAIWKAAANIYSYPIDAGGEFILCAIANPRSRISQFGRFIEPEGGWSTTSVDTDEWESVPQMDGKKAIIIRLDFTKSPNVLSETRVSKHLPTRARVKARMDALRAKGAENDPDHWCYDRGYPPPEGLSKTVFTESMLDLHKAYDRHQFTGSNFLIIGACDPARTGDRFAVRFAAMGEIRPGVMGIEWMPAVILFPDATNKLPIAYQYMGRLKELCANVDYRGQKYVCDPRNFGIDCGNDASFADICQKDWAPNLIRIQFGGAASEEPMSMEDQRPANVACKNKRAEMFFKTRQAVESGQLKGIDKDAAAELTTLEYSEFREDMTQKPIVVQDKKEYRLKFGKSPDLADCGIMIIEVARLLGFSIVSTGYTVERDKEFDKVVQLADQVYQDITYSADNEEWEPQGVESL